ncbi:centromere protein S-like [Stegodyphus dumicola]|uniref:centromere protein S-like n=1 Tax=Stegodyphus dumicola TaxID=202533 RepID=UPI0015AE9490|nr:centromere protein S-like [Stegodyphus dumicola]
MEESELQAVNEEKLKISLHYAVCKICAEVAKEYEAEFDKECMAILSELAFRQAGLYAKDLELFAKHAKRSTINIDDVKLLVRRNESLLEHVNKMAADLMANAAQRKSKKKKTETESVS